MSHWNSFYTPHMPMKGPEFSIPFHLPVLCLSSASDCSPEMFQRVYFSWMKCLFSGPWKVIFFQPEGHGPTVRTSRKITDFSLVITSYVICVNGKMNKYNYFVCRVYKCCRWSFWLCSLGLTAGIALYAWYGYSQSERALNKVKLHVCRLGFSSTFIFGIRVTGCGEI